MCCFAVGLYCRAIRLVAGVVVFIVVAGCHAKALHEDPLSAVSSSQGSLSAVFAPIPQPTNPLRFLPAPVAASSVVNSSSRDQITAISDGPIRRADRQSLRSPAILPMNMVQGLFSVVVQKVPAHEVLFALARDSALQLDIVGQVSGDITMNAVDLPLNQILRKIAQQVDISYEFGPGSLRVVADVPKIRSYTVDYLNMSRSTQSRVDLATQIGSIRSTAGEGQQGSAGSNGSRMSIENSSVNDFWQTLTANITGILKGRVAGSDDQQSAGSDIFVNRESGIIAVRATNRQHRTIAALINDVVDSAKRQVLIEATVVEITLSDSFESGIDWRILDNNGGTAVDYAQILSATPAAAEALTAGSALLSYRNSRGSLGDVTATLKLLRQFGDVQVLSSPKIIALNNQPALLKVVDNRVYFTFEVDRQQDQNGDSRTIVDSTVHSVPIGLVMNVTPFINSENEVILNVRPTISRILNFAQDPGPALAGQTQIQNLIPEIQVREMESVMRVRSGEVAIIGGLMQNKVDKRNTGLPGVGRLPLLGKIFSRDTKKLEKTELLVFLRPTVMRSDDFKRDGDQLRRFVPYQNDRLLMSKTNTGIDP